MINSGVDFSTNQKSLELAKRHDFIFATLGLSPNTLKAQGEGDLNRLLGQIKENAGSAVGIGEAGLDYYHCKEAAQRERQAQIFRRIIDLAESLGLPLVIHSRDAESRALEMVRHLDMVVFHCYSGSLGTMKEAVDRGFYISLARNVPLDHLLVETDSPFLSPRSGRNEPAFVQDSVRLIAKIRGMEPQEIARLTAENTRRVYGIR
jgi:TatD DNase family protein